MTISRNLKKFHSRGQIDVIDLWIKEETDYKYLFIYEDCFSRYIVINGMRTNSVQETAKNLLDVITMIGSPEVIQSTKGIEFTKQVLRELQSMWPDIFLLYSETIEFEGLKKDYKKIIDLWLTKNPTKSWREGIKIIQAIENSKLNPLIKKSPFYSLFTCCIKIPFKYYKENCVNDESNVNEIIINDNTNANEKTVEGEINKDLQTIISQNMFEHNYSANEEKNSECISFSTSRMKNNSITDNESGCNDVSSASSLESFSMRCEGEESDLENLLFNQKTKSNTVNEGYTIIKISTKQQQQQSSSSVKCFICKETFATRTMLKKHEMLHAEEMKFACSKCDKHFFQENELKIHERLHIDEKKFACLFCPKKFVQVNILKKHMREHGENICQHWCEICSARFFSVSELTKHVAENHTKSPAVSCEICKKRFLVPAMLRRHVYNAHKIRYIHQCGFCSKTFNHMGEFMLHKQTHSNERPFSCELCAKTFKHPSSLRKHKKAMHSGVYFECDQCRAMFQHKRDLRNHVFQVHEVKQSHICPVCDKAFPVRSRLTVHMRVHDKTVAHKCNHCDKKFRQIYNLKKHNEQHHPDKKPQKLDMPVDQ